MLSILIPVYNEDVRQLVDDLCRQGRGLVDFEVLCFDDGSKMSYKEKNRSLQDIKEVHYKEMAENQGRSRIRNLLADAAKGEYLLFMDGDSKVVKKDYLATYVKALEPDSLLYGGRCYLPEKPTNPELLFHWTYGIAREQQSAAERKKQPYHSFMTNNFLMSASRFHEIRFDESLKQYGHEDTLFGMELRKRQIRMHHLDNPLEHTGLESAEVFLDKTKKAIENLHMLVSSGKPIETRLLSAFAILKRFGMLNLFLRSFGVVEQRIYNNLISGQSSMLAFDLYKLGILARVASL